jgi:hypothetical protein
MLVNVSALLFINGQEKESIWQVKSHSGPLLSIPLRPQHSCSLKLDSWYRCVYVYCWFKLPWEPLTHFMHTQPRRTIMCEFVFSFCAHVCSLTSVLHRAEFVCVCVRENLIWLIYSWVSVSVVYTQVCCISLCLWLTDFTSSCGICSSLPLLCLSSSAERSVSMPGASPVQTGLCPVHTNA